MFATVEINQTASIVKTTDEKALDIIGQAGFSSIVKRLCSDEPIYYRQFRAAALDLSDNMEHQGSPPSQELCFSEKVFSRNNRVMIKCFNFRSYLKKLNFSLLSN